MTELYWYKRHRADEEKITHDDFDFLAQDEEGEASDLEEMFDSGLERFALA